MHAFRISVCLISLMLAACGGGYQAPVSEQGEQQQNRSPIIVESSNNDEGQLIVERGRALENTNTSGGLARTERSSTRNTIPPSQRSSSTRVTAPSGGDVVRTPTSHTVRSGDTLYSIAFAYDLDFRTLALANGLRAPYTIFVGQTVNLNVDEATASTSASVVNSAIGTAVTDSSVAQAQGSSARRGGVLRQPITSSSDRMASWTWPHSGRITEGFRQGNNKGLDIAGSPGDPVYAAGAGDVVYSGAGVQGTGNLIIIRHNDSYLSAYAHNQSMIVSEGDQVREGQQIAEMGNDTKGQPLLHFEIRRNGKSVDPQGLLPSR